MKVTAYIAAVKLERDKTVYVGLKGKLQTGNLDHEWVLSTSGYAQDNSLLRQTGTVYASNTYNPAVIAKPSISIGSNLPRIGETRMNSVAMADTLSTADKRWQLTLGARHQEVRTRTFNGTSGAETARYEKSAITPMAA